MADVPPPPDGFKGFDAPPPPDGVEGFDAPPPPDGVVGSDVPPPPDGAVGSDVPPPPDGVEGFDVPPPPDGVVGSDVTPPPDWIEGPDAAVPTDDLEPNLGTEPPNTGESNNEFAPVDVDYTDEEPSSEGPNETADVATPRRSRKPALVFLVLAVCGGIWVAAQTDSDADTGPGNLDVAGLSSDDVSTTSAPVTTGDPPATTTSVATPTTTVATPTTTVATPTTTVATPTTTVASIPGGDSSGPSFSGVAKPSSVDPGGTVRVTGTVSDPSGVAGLYVAISGVVCQPGSNPYDNRDPAPTSITFDLTCIVNSNQAGGVYSAEIYSQDTLSNSAYINWDITIGG